jgi:methionyl aminopeptidase
MGKLLPNDPCWCGSGIKLKKCHKTEEAKDDTLSSLVKQGYKLPHKNLIKSAEQINKLREAGKVTRGILDMLQDRIKPGVSTLEIDEWVSGFTKKAGAIPAPLNYKGFPKSCCTSINNVICHGIPAANDILADGDIINVDITSILNGYYADSSRMYCIGQISAQAQKLVDVAKECLYIGMNEVKPYARLYNIGDRIEEHANKNGFSVVRDLCGHGIGEEFHQDPEIVHYTQRNKKGLILMPGMVFTIEPMINEGVYRCNYSKDGWTVLTADGKLSAQWEHTIAVTETGYEILT